MIQIVFVVITFGFFYRDGSSYHRRHLSMVVWGKEASQ